MMVERSLCTVGIRAHLAEGPAGQRGTSAFSNYPQISQVSCTMPPWELISNFTYVKAPRLILQRKKRHGFYSKFITDFLIMTTWEGQILKWTWKTWIRSLSNIIWHLQRAIDIIWQPNSNHSQDSQNTTAYIHILISMITIIPCLINQGKATYKSEADDKQSRINLSH